MSTKNRHAVALGRKGGQTTTTRKANAARKNGKKGGRPKLKTAVERFISDQKRHAIVRRAYARGIALLDLTTVPIAKALAILCLVVALTGCSQPFAPSGAGDAFAVPPMLAPVMAVLDADPWMHPLLGGERMGDYVRGYLQGIRLDPSLPPDVGAMFNRETHWLHWQPRNTPETHSAQVLASVILHEARHGQGIRHSCDGGTIKSDRTMEEGGAFAVQILYLEHQHAFNVAAGLRRDYIGCH